MIHATFHKSRQGYGILTINALGISKLFKVKKSITVGDCVDLFFNADTNQIAIKRSATGKFDVVESDILLNAIKIITNPIDTNITNLSLRIEDSQEYDFILVPINSDLKAVNSQIAE